MHVPKQPLCEFKYAARKQGFELSSRHAIANRYIFASGFLHNSNKETIKISTYVSSVTLPLIK